MQIRVAIPVYDGKVPAETARCLLDEKTIAFGIGDDVVVEFLPGCSHPAMGRNQLAKTFLDSGADKLIFLDSDITFDPGSLIKLAHYPVDFVGAGYRYKMNEELYTVGWLDGELWANELGLLEVKSLGTGFLCLSRKVFEDLKQAFPEREFEHFANKLFCYFQMPFQGRLLYGEDAYFCKEWRDIGGKIYLDPEITLTHWDFSPTPYKGHVGNWLKSRFAGDRSAGDAM